VRFRNLSLGRGGCFGNTSCMYSGMQFGETRASVSLDGSSASEVASLHFA
jgi:hypothetical protein